MILLLAADTERPDYYLNYLPLVSYAWERFMPELELVLVTVGRAPAWTKDYVQDVHELPPIPDIFRGCQATMARLFYAAQLRRGVLVTLEDLDLIPLQRAWHVEKLRQASSGIMLMGPEVYGAPKYTDHPIAPMSKATALSSTWKRIIDCDCWEDFVDQFRGTGKKMPDNCIDVLNAPYFNDEAVLRRLLINAGIEPHLIPRGYNLVTDTVDRAFPEAFDVQKLKRGEYIEAHLPRPVSRNLQFLQPLLDYIGCGKEEICRGE